MHRHRHLRAIEAQTGPTGESTTQTTVGIGDGDHNTQLTSADDVRLCAYRKWESAGKPIGNGIQFWLEAEQELKQKK